MNDKTKKYLQSLSTQKRTELTRLFKLTKMLVPMAEETISYGIPAFKYNGQPLIYFAAFKNHYSVFPTSGPINKLSGKLTKYKVSKGTIQYTNDSPIPDNLLAEIILYRKEEIENGNKTNV